MAFIITVVITSVENSNCENKQTELYSQVQWWKAMNLSWSNFKPYLPHKFKGNTQVISEVEVFSHMYYIKLIIFVFPS